MKVYYLHPGCSAEHRSYRTLARCLWPRAVWIRGDGPYALLARCRAFTITLHKTPAGAIAAKQRIDADGCGSRCVGEHEVIRMDIPVGRTPVKRPDAKARSNDNLYDKQRSRLWLKK